MSKYYYHGEEVKTMAGLYPEEVIQDVLERTDIVDLIGHYVHLKRAGRGYMGLCPFHNEKTGSFHVSDEKQLYHCFGCGVGGNAIHFVMAAENLDFVDALKYLASSANVILPEPTSSSVEIERHEMRKKMYETTVAVARFYRDQLFSDAGKEARAYVEKRALTEQTVAHFGIGFAPEGGALLRFAKEQGIDLSLLLALGLVKKEDGKSGYYDFFRNRLMVPIIDLKKNIIGFGGRALYPNPKSKYLNPPASAIFDKGNELFSLNYAKNSKDKRIILCEGYMDVISLHQAGFTGAVASMGTSLTPGHARILKKYASEVYLSYDSDGAGQAATDRAIELLQPLEIKVRVLTLPECKDPDEYIKLRGREAFELQVMQKAKSVTDYRIDKLRARYDLNDLEQKIEFTGEAAGVLVKIRNPIEQEAYIKKLSDETGISEDAIGAEIAKRDRAFKKREEKKIFTRPVKQPETEKKTAGIPDRSAEAEKVLLSLMTRDRKIYERFAGSFPPEAYSTEAHRELAAHIYRALEEKKEPEIAIILTALPAELSGEASAVFTDEDYGDNMVAAEDAVAVLEAETFARLSKQYIAENNIEKLNELIRKQAEKKRKEGQTNE